MSTFRQTQSSPGRWSDLASSAAKAGKRRLAGPGFEDLSESCRMAPRSESFDDSPDEIEVVLRVDAPVKIAEFLLTREHRQGIDSKFPPMTSSCSRSAGPSA